MANCNLFNGKADRNQDGKITLNEGYEYLANQDLKTILLVAGFVVSVIALWKR